KTAFGGFQKFHCPHCRAIILYPLARKTFYWFIPAVVAIVFFFVLLSLLDSEWGEEILMTFAALPIRIDEKKSLILWPLFLWSLVRLGGMYSKKVLEISRKILYGTGILAFLTVILALLGFVAGVVRVGIVLPPVIGALLLLGFFIFVMARDASIRKKIEGLGR
ncbi:MAG TPA: hypothetical protein VLR91_02175, partial [Thermodesulfobacteriota bacterium]|nr:hypothetical protein [Thermodesulfobacteriota bacterium]